MKLQRHEADFESKMDMTPLIDCVFLLIMFFILTTQITVNITIDAAAAAGALGPRGEGQHSGSLAWFDFEFGDVELIGIPWSARPDHISSNCSVSDFIMRGPVGPR